jgi:hypothetical protein
MATSALDLNSIIALQQTYANDLAGLNVDQGASVINALDTNLTKLQSAASAASASINDTLTKQSIVNGILETENDRLTDKKKSIDNAISGQRRILQLNDSYRKRYAAYTRLILAIVFTLVVLFLVNLLKKRFPIIPDSVVMLLYIIIVSAYIIYAILLVADINRRDRTNFDELDLNGPSVIDPAAIKKQSEKAAQSGDLLGYLNINGCVGSYCCGPTTKYSATYSRCMPDPLPTCSNGQTYSLSADGYIGKCCETGQSVDKDGNCAAPSSVAGFTTINQAYEIEKPTDAFVPSEFSNYSKI